MFPFAKTAAGDGPRRPSWQAGGDALLQQAPGLKDGTERLIASLVKSLQTMAGTATTIEGMTRGFAPAGLRDILAAHKADSVAALIECAALRCNIFVTLDSLLVHAIVELLCGGNGVEPIAEIPRDVTPIDQQFAHILVTLVASGIQKEWADRGFGTMRPQKLDGNIPADICGARVQDVGLVSISIAAFGLEGTMRLVLPPAALERFGNQDATEATTVESGDPLWTARLQHELGRAPVRVEAFLDAKDLTLGNISELKVGQIIALPPDTRSRATLVCDGRALYRGEVGQLDDRYSLRVDEIVTDAPKPAPDVRPTRSPLSELSRA